MKIEQYDNSTPSSWESTTNKLLKHYPIKNNEIMEIAITCWEKIWETKIGNEIPLSSIDMPATVIGYFFQKMFAKELSSRYPDVWRGESTSRDKDLVCTVNDLYSTEMKISGQKGYEIYGNRSYNQDTSRSKKDKSGFYILLNFYKKKITMIRIGWLDKDDWIPQSSSSGQSAKIRKEAYSGKMMEIVGDYILQTPVELLSGIGSKTLSEFHNEDIYSFQDLLNYCGDNELLIKNKSKIINKYAIFSC